MADHKKHILRSKIARGLEEGAPVVTIVDEVSMLTSITLGHIDTGNCVTTVLLVLSSSSATSCRLSRSVAPP